MNKVLIEIREKKESKGSRGLGTAEANLSECKSGVQKPMGDQTGRTMQNKRAAKSTQVKADVRSDMQELDPSHFSDARCSDFHLPWGHLLRTTTGTHEAPGDETSLLTYIMD